MSGVVEGAIQVGEGAQTRRRSVLPRLLGCLLVACIGYELIPIYYYYFDFKASCSIVLRDAAVQSDEEIKRGIVEALREKGLEKQPRDIGVQRIGRRVKVWFSYTTPIQVSVNGRTVTLMNLEFTPSAEGVVSE
jgi:hypothetical protein